MRGRGCPIIVVTALTAISGTLAATQTVRDLKPPPLVLQGRAGQIPSPLKLGEYRKISLPITISNADVITGKCAEPGRLLRISGLGFGARADGRTIRLVRRLDLGALSTTNWADGSILATIPPGFPQRSYYEVVVADAAGRWISNLARVPGCGIDVTIAKGVVARLPADITFAAFPQDRCRTVNLDVLDVTYERISREEGVFRIVDDRGTIVSFVGWSSDQAATAFVYILEHWLTTVCYGPRMGNYDQRATYRLMLWLDRDGRTPSRADFPADRSSCFGGCADHTTNRQFTHCRIVPSLSTLTFGRVEANVRDTRTGFEDVPWSATPVWGIRRPHVVGPRTLYSVDDWPLFTGEGDVAWAKRYFVRPETTLCSFGAFNSNRRAGSDEHDGMQMVVR